MEEIFRYLEPVAIGFVIWLPFLANQYLRRAQKELSRQRR